MKSETPTASSPEARAHIIVCGNEKGGSGKSTVAMHLSVGLMRLGYKVGTLDLDSHQGTFTSYVKNRWQYIKETGDNLPCPEHIHLNPSIDLDLVKSREEERININTALGELKRRNDFIIIDTPGSDRYMSIVGHSYADTLVTPINDSYVDLDVLAKIDPHTHKMIKPSVYAEMVWELRRQHKAKNSAPLNWFVMRNRVSATDSKHKQDIDALTKDLCYQLGFRLAPGFSERVIFRELFLQGRTLLDLREGDKKELSASNLNARQEAQKLVRRILPQKEVSTLSLLKTY